MKPSLDCLRLNDIKYFDFHALEYLRLDMKREDEAISDLRAGDAQPEKILTHERRRENFEKRLRTLERLHKHLAPIMRREAAKLFALPPELRNMVYAHLYVKDQPIEVVELDSSCWPPRPQYGVLPVDAAGLMSSYHVGQEVAEDAAKVFYASNIFRVDDLGHLPKFLDTDQYETGILPKDYVKKLFVSVYANANYTREGGLNFSTHWLSLKQRNNMDDVSDIDFEDRYDDWLFCERTWHGERNIPESEWRRDSRYLLEPLFRIPRLQEVEIRIEIWGDRTAIPFELRKASPLILLLKENGVKVKAQSFDSYYIDYTGCGYGITEYRGLKDITNLFDKPTDDDRLHVAQTEHDASDTVRRDARWIRVKLYEHLETFKSLGGLDTVRQG